MASTKPATDTSDPAQFILLHEKDNILVCARSAIAGTHIEIDGCSYVLDNDIQLGHKVARHELSVGEKILRYSFPIGSMTAQVKPGEHVHSHNLKSDYIPAHGRDAVRFRGIRS